MKLFDFSNKNYGWPFSANTFQFMQEQLLQLQTLSLLGGSLYVVSGCVNVAGNVGDGFVVINGEVLRFVGGAVQTNVVVLAPPTTASFGDPATGATPQIYNYSYDRYATFGTSSTQYAWANFENKDMAKGMLQRLKEAEANITNNATAVAAVTTAFNAYQPAWADITGKPSGLIVHHGDVSIGDIDSDKSVTVNIPNQGDNNYQVLPTIYSNGNPLNDNDCGPVLIGEQTATTFKIIMGETREGVQKVSVKYIIIKF